MTSHNERVFSCFCNNKLVSISARTVFDKLTLMQMVNKFFFFSIEASVQFDDKLIDCSRESYRNATNNF